MEPNDRPETDPDAREAARYRHESLAAGLMTLPNLFFRSVLTLTLLYGLLTLALITLVEFDYLTSGSALVIGVVLAVLQFTLGPWVMDLMLHFLYAMRWVRPEELPEHLRSFVARVCEKHQMRFPDFGIIDDGAPQAFTYGHHPGNARVVISRGLMEILAPEELEAVVAHELGHARNWDMALMTVANLVPLLLYYIYEATRPRENNKNGRGTAVAVGAYVLYIISQYIVLWFSRTREFHADRFAGEETGNPNALSRALIKIAYGLAARGTKPDDAPEAEAGAEKPRKRNYVGAGAWGALNIADSRTSVTLVMNSGGTTEASRGVELERVKSAMQWDLWNPWAGWFELHSTHPLTAKRLLALSDQASAMGQEPLVTFDRKKPESYWDEFLIDVAVLLLPLVGILSGPVIYFGVGLMAGTWLPELLLLSVALFGLGLVVRTLLAYRGKIFPHLSVAALLGHVKVSPVRPVPATVTGTIIGKGVPGLVFSEDFVLRDGTGILFLDYRQPLAIWDFLFGLLRAGNYQGKEVRVTGWFRREPVPYLEIYKLEVLDGSRSTQTCYTYYAALFSSVLIAVLGFLGLAFFSNFRLF
jgi:Zn-dependent protease with chaperone function